MRRTKHMALALLTLLAVRPLGAQDKVAPAKEVMLQTAWIDLAGEDQARVVRAGVVIGRSPGEGVAFLKEHLRPVKADAQILARWLADLDNDDPATRSLAQEELEYLDKYIKTDLKKAIAMPPSAESRRRVQQLLERIESAEKQAKAKTQPPPALKGRSVGVSNNNGQLQIIIDGVPLDLTPRVITQVGPPRAWLRAVRAVGILEGIATPEARQLLEAVASGEPDALPTTEARAALARLAKQ
jgi:hypothetical protein